jgi:hypothetical protein
MEDRTKESVNATRHTPTHDTTRINRAIERAVRDSSFVDQAISQLSGLAFPAFKHSILNHIRSINTNKDQDDNNDIVALYESLDGYIQFRDPYHVQKVFEENIPSRKKEYQITEGKRQNPDVQIRQTYADSSIKEREAVTEAEERKDYPEVTPTDMKKYICDNCGKQFQNQQDLVHHKQFENGTPTT